MTEAILGWIKDNQILSGIGTTVLVLIMGFFKWLGTRGERVSAWFRVDPNNADRWYLHISNHGSKNIVLKTVSAESSPSNQLHVLYNGQQITGHSLRVGESMECKAISMGGTFDLVTLKIEGALKSSSKKFKRSELGKTKEFKL